MSTSALVALLCSVALTISPATRADSADAPDAPIEISFRFSVETQEQRRIAESAVVTVFENCPGLRKYRRDFVPEVVEVHDVSWGGEFLETAVVKVAVSDMPTSIPRDYYAQGHHCYFDVRADMTEMQISKRACKSLCVDHAVTDLGVLTIPLIPAQPR